MSKRVLGRGLDALMPNNVSDDNKDNGAAAEASAVNSEGVTMIALDQIHNNPLQPRRYFDELKLSELAESIKVHGVVQPVVVAKVAEGYRLIIGERRCRASRLAGLTEIPALVRDYADQQMLEVALIENLQREDLNPIEEAQAFQYLLTEHSLTQEQLAARLGCSRPSVTNSLRLLSLPDEIRKDLEAGIIKPGHARALLSIADEKERYKAWQKIKKDNLSVRQAELLAARINEGRDSENSASSKRSALSPEWEDIVDRLREHLNAEVRIVPKARGKGRIELHYSDQDQLERLVEHLIYVGGRGGRRDDNFLS